MRLAIESLPLDGMPVPLSSIVRVEVRFVGQQVHAGFPSPADDFIEKSVDLNDVLIRNPTATYIWRVAGDCMIDCKIFPGDVVVVDKSLQPRHRSIVLAIVDNHPTLKRVRRVGDRLVLHNENDQLPPFTVSEGTDVKIWGVVTATIRELQK